MVQDHETLLASGDEALKAGDWIAARDAFKRALDVAETPEALNGLTEAASNAEAWAGEPFLHSDEDAAEVLAPGTSRRMALDAARRARDRASQRQRVLGIARAPRDHQ
jgi:hypothetical protein